MNNKWSADKIFEALGYKLVTKEEDPFVTDDAYCYRKDLDEILIKKPNSIAKKTCQFLKRDYYTHISKFINEVELEPITRKIEELNKK